MTLRIVQLTDCHLFADPQQALRGITTWPRFTAILQRLRQQIPQVDLLVFTGDTAHDENAATYSAVQRELIEWIPNVRFVPGNHDNRAALQEHFPTPNRPCEGRVTFCEQRDGWQLIGLDTQRPGEVSGSVGREQLVWLEANLESARHLPTLLFLHHPPIEVQSAWLDKIGLQDRGELARMLKDHLQVRLISCGHVHQEVIASLGHATVFTTPAVGVPFRPRTEQLEIDTDPPQFRLWELAPDGRWSTQVLR